MVIFPSLLSLKLNPFNYVTSYPSRYLTDNALVVRCSTWDNVCLEKYKLINQIFIGLIFLKSMISFTNALDYIHQNSTKYYRIFFLLLKLYFPLKIFNILYVTTKKWKWAHCVFMIRNTIFYHKIYEKLKWKCIVYICVYNK